jgi:hypothetical protein
MGRRKEWYWLNPTERLWLEEIAKKCHNRDLNEALFYAIKKYYDSCSK